MAYLDNSATTKVFEQVADLMVKVMETDFGNPSSLHKMGVAAEAYITKARTQIADTLKVQPKEIIFTSGGTESNNMALIGTALSCSRRGKHIITTAIEHASISAVLDFLAQQGFEITYLPVDAKGRVSLEALKAAVRKDTILVSMMYVNNEIGTVQPVEEAAQIIHEINPQTLFHVDAIQAYGKFRIRPKRQGIDMLSVSGHKIHGPKGVGFLYCRDRINLHPIIFGGGQQNAMRSGTENVPGIAGLGLASELIYQSFDERHEKACHVHRYFLEQISALEGVHINGYNELEDEQSEQLHSPFIASVSFEGVRSEVLLHALEEKDVYVSAGSACSSNHHVSSSTLSAIGLEKALAEGTVRFSFSVFTEESDIDQAVEALKEILPMLRRYTRK